MKGIKTRILMVTGMVCLLPVLPGISLWDSLPDTMAIHFDLYGQPDRFSSKGFVVFGLPVLMALLQMICCFINDFNAQKHGERKKLALASKWIIPVMSLVLQTATLGYGLGWQVEIRMVAALLVGGVFLVIGNYLPKFDNLRQDDPKMQKAQKINRFIGFETVMMGILFLVSIFLPPVSTVICVLLLIPYALISMIYGIAAGRK